MSVLFLFLLMPALSGAGEMAPDTYVLQAELNVWDAAAKDLNGDGLKEILLLCCDETSYPLEKHVAVYMASERGWPEKADFIFRLDPAYSVFFFAETDCEAPAELVAADASEAVIHHFTGSGFEVVKTIPLASLFPMNLKEPRFLRRLTRDLDGDGRDEWLIPTASGYELRSMEGSKGILKCDLASTMRQGDNLYFFHRLPACHTFTQEEGQPPGLAFLSDEFADFYGGPDWQTHHRFRVPLNLEEKWDASASMKDVNNDGFPDLLVTQTRGTVRLEAQTAFYLAAEPFTYPETPTATFSGKGAFVMPELVDVDGDKQLDLVLVSVPIGMRNIMNYFLRGKVSVEAQVYRFDGARFSDAPVYRDRLTMDAPEGREEVAWTMADFNADGRLDVAYCRTSELLVIHTGEADRFVSSSPRVELQLPGFGVARAGDLNGNDASDILFHHPAGDHSKRVDLILF